MAATNETTNYGLPQWEASDKPERADFNAAFNAIDTTVASHFASLGIQFKDYTDADLNNVDSNAIVQITQNAINYNAPSIGVYLCFGLGGIKAQIGVNQNSNDLYIRSRNYATWTSWKNL